MSHTTTIKSITVRDLDALSRAVQELAGQGVKIRFERNARPRMYFGHQEEDCAAVVRLDGATSGSRTFDVGFKAVGDGTYTPIYDPWVDAVKGQIGAACPVPSSEEGKAQHDIGRLLQEYAKYAAIGAATAQGYMVTGTTKDAAGNIHLTVAA